jgi:hypothetical protein
VIQAGEIVGASYRMKADRELWRWTIRLWAPPPGPSGGVSATLDEVMAVPRQVGCAGMIGAEKRQNAKGSPARKRPTASSDCSSTAGEAVAVDPDRRPSHGPSGGAADSLEGAAFRAAWERGRMGIAQKPLHLVKGIGASSRPYGLG